MIFLLIPAGLLISFLFLVLFCRVTFLLFSFVPDPVWEVFCHVAEHVFDRLPKRGPAIVAAASVAIAWLFFLLVFALPQYFLLSFFNPFS